MEPEVAFEHACNELLWRQGGVPKVACFALKSGSSRSQGWLFWSQCSVTPPKGVRIAAKKDTYHSRKTRMNRGFTALLCSNPAQTCTYHSICCHGRIAIDAWRRNFGGVMLHAPSVTKKYFCANETNYIYVPSRSRQRAVLVLCRCCDGAIEEINTLFIGGHITAP